MSGSIQRAAIILMGAGALAACSGESEPSEAPAASSTESAQPASTQVMAAAEAPGKLQFLQCAACHAVEADAAPKVGPNLHCVIGRKAAALEDFNYSASFKQAAASGLVWEREQLSEFIEKPMSVVPGNSMAFGGVADAKNREAIMDYLAATCGSDDG